MRMLAPAHILLLKYKYKGKDMYNQISTEKRSATRVRKRQEEKEDA